MKLRDRKLKDGLISFFPISRGLGWTVAFEIPRCMYLAKRQKKWTFYHSAGVDIGLSNHEIPEIEIYYLALYSIVKIMQEWLRIVERAVEYEKARLKDKHEARF